MMVDRSGPYVTLGPRTLASQRAPASKPAVLVDQVTRLSYNSCAHHGSDIRSRYVRGALRKFLVPPRRGGLQTKLLPGGRENSRSCSHFSAFQVALNDSTQDHLHLNGGGSAPTNAAIHVDRQKQDGNEDNDSKSLVKG